MNVHWSCLIGAIMGAGFVFLVGFRFGVNYGVRATLHRWLNCTCDSDVLGRCVVHQKDRAA